MTQFAGSNTTNFGGSSPTGNFVPEIFSKKVLSFFRRSSIVEGITNNEFYGEIMNAGDTVRVIKEPTMTVASYSSGDTISLQALSDNEITLVLDKANAFGFQVDDIEKQISHINWEVYATNSAMYSLKQAYDREVLTYMSGQALAANTVNNTTEAAVIDLSTADALLNQMSNLARRLDEQDIPEEGRWLVLNPAALEVLAKADSRLLDLDYNGGGASLRNGLAFGPMLRGFRVYKTNNAPTYTSTGSGGTTRDILMAGHMSSTATASVITKTEMFRSPTTFSDIVRGLHVYGRDVIYPEALAVAHVRYS